VSVRDGDPEVVFLDHEPGKHEALGVRLSQFLMRFGILLVLLLLMSDCRFLLHPINSTFARHSNPIADWPGSSLVNLEQNQTIREDYQKYIKKLPPKERNRVGSVLFFEDRTGHHAVQIEVNWKGTRWQHVLIYDKSDKRVRVVKYVGGYYMS